MRKSIFLAAEAWRQHYGQLATGSADNPEAKLDFKLPSTGETITLEGWQTETRQGEQGDHVVALLGQALQHRRAVSAATLPANRQR